MVLYAEGYSCHCGTDRWRSITQKWFLRHQTNVSPRCLSFWNCSIDRKTLDKCAVIFRASWPIGLLTSREISKCCSSCAVTVSPHWSRSEAKLSKFVPYWSDSWNRLPGVKRHSLVLNSRWECVKNTYWTYPRTTNSPYLICCWSSVVLMSGIADDEDKREIALRRTEHNS